MHRTKFKNFELPVLHSSALLHVKQGAGGLQSLRDENDHGQNREDNQHHRKRDREINRALGKSVERIFERFFAQPDKSEAAIFEMSDRVVQSLFQIAQDEETDAKLITNLNHALVRLGSDWELEENDLSDAMIVNDLLELIAGSEQRQFAVVDLWIVGN